MRKHGKLRINAEEKQLKGQLSDVKLQKGQLSDVRLRKKLLPVDAEDVRLLLLPQSWQWKSNLKPVRFRKFRSSQTSRSARFFFVYFGSECQDGSRNLKMR